MLSYSDSNAKVGKRIQKTNGIRGTESGLFLEGRIRTCQGTRIRAVRVPKSGLYGSPNPGITKSSESGTQTATSE